MKRELFIINDKDIGKISFIETGVLEKDTLIIDKKGLKLVDKINLIKLAVQTLYLLMI